MTEQQAKAKLIAWCNNEVGYHEGAGNWNKYCEDPLLAKLLGWKPQNEAWCDSFTDEAFLSCFGLEATSKMTYQPIGKGSAACRYSAQFFKDNGAFFYRPSVGDVVFFISSGAINHQGIVTNVSDGVITTVEGNSSDSVARRSYSYMSDARIAGYGRPKWSVVSDPDEASTGEVVVTPTVSKTNELPILKQGDKNESVRAAQFMLIGYGYYCGGKIRNGKEEADSDFGKSTASATKKFQASRGLVQDEKIGPETWAALLGIK